MKHIVKEFVSGEKKKFSFSIGKLLASGLSGFIAGFIVASIGWIVVIYLIFRSNGAV